jgi:hypothetical protein
MAGEEDRDVRKRYGPVLVHELGEIEAVFVRNVVRDDRLALLECKSFGRLVRQGYALLADNARSPTDTGADQASLSARFNLNDLCKACVEGAGNQPTAFVQDHLQIVARKSELAKIGKGALTTFELLAAGTHFVPLDPAKELSARQNVPWRQRQGRTVAPSYLATGRAAIAVMRLARGLAVAPAALLIVISGFGAAAMNRSAARAVSAIPSRSTHTIHS